MEAIGLLVTLEARRGKEADAEAFLKSAQPLARDEKGALKRYVLKLGPGKPQCPLEWRDREGMGIASQRIAGGALTD